LAELREIEVLVQERNGAEDLSAGETEFLAKVSEILYSTTVSYLLRSPFAETGADG
jgi:hypothetical protein